jgi:hypothetical protein
MGINFVDVYIELPLNRSPLNARALHSVLRMLTYEHFCLDRKFSFFMTLGESERGEDKCALVLFFAVGEGCRENSLGGNNLRGNYCCFSFFIFMLSCGGEKSLS